jgi:hypothetical protein
MRYRRLISVLFALALPFAAAAVDDSEIRLTSAIPGDTKVCIELPPDPPINEPRFTCMRFRDLRFFVDVKRAEP